MANNQSMLLIGYLRDTGVQCTMMAMIRGEPEAQVLWFEHWKIVRYGETKGYDMVVISLKDQTMVVDYGPDVTKLRQGYDYCDRSLRVFKIEYEYRRFEQSVIWKDATSDAIVLASVIRSKLPFEGKDIRST